MTWAAEMCKGGNADFLIFFFFKDISIKPHLALTIIDFAGLIGTRIMSFSELHSQNLPSQEKTAGNLQKKLVMRLKFDH